VTSLRAALPTVLGSSSDFDWVKRSLPFPTRAHRLRGPLAPYSLGTGGFFRGIKGLGREAGHSLYCKDYGCVELDLCFRQLPTAPSLHVQVELA